MASLFSLPVYPTAVNYNVQYSDPLGGNANRPNPFGTWTTLTGSPFTSPSNIYDSAGNPALRLYRAAPTIPTPSSGNITLPYFEAFTVRQPAPGVWTQNLYDPQITMSVNPFRAFIGDYGNAASASTNFNIDTGAGVGFLVPDGVTLQFNVAEIPDTTPPIILEYSTQVIKNNVDLILGTDYVVNWELGYILFATAPATNDVIQINYKEVKYSNAQICAAIQTAVDSLALFNINGYSVIDDNNVKNISGTISNAGLRALVFAIALKILNRAMTRRKSDEARAYKTQDFSIDTVPGRVIDGMSQQSNFDYQEIKAMANAYIKTATIPTVRDSFASFLDATGILPILNVFPGSFYGMGWGWM